MWVEVVWSVVLTMSMSRLSAGLYILGTLPIDL